MKLGKWIFTAALGAVVVGFTGALTTVDAKAQTTMHVPPSGSPYVMLNQERAAPWLLQLQPGYRVRQRAPSGRIIDRSRHVQPQHARPMQSPHAHVPHQRRAAHGRAMGQFGHTQRQRVVPVPVQQGRHLQRHIAPVGHPHVQHASIQPSHQLNPIYLPQVVSYQTHHPVGTIIVDPHNHFLYLVEPGGQARRYGVGVGRAGFGWSGQATIRRKAEWPTWTPPAAMIRRQPELERWRNGMPGGVENPLGARALYLYQGGRDTLYRIHGTNEPWTIGQSMSSGCIRMRNEDVEDLYTRVRIGARVVVL